MMQPVVWVGNQRKDDSVGRQRRAKVTVNGWQLIGPWKFDVEQIQNTQLVASESDKVQTPAKIIVGSLCNCKCSIKILVVREHSNLYLYFE